MRVLVAKWTGILFCLFSLLALPGISRAEESESDETAAKAAEPSTTQDQQAQAKPDLPANPATQEAHQGEEAAARSPAESGKYTAMLIQKIDVLQEKLLDKIETKIADQQASRMGTISDMLGWFSLAGILLIFTPFFIRKRGSGKMGTMFKYSFIAALTFVVAVNLFTLVMVVMRTAQGAVSTLTNPQIAVVESSLDTIKENAEHLSAIGPMLLDVPLAQLESGEEESLPVAILNNAQKLKADVAVFAKIGGLFKSISWVFAYIPIALTLLAVFLFLKSIKDVMLDVVRIPAVASLEDPTKARQTLRRVFVRVWRELLTTLVFIGVLLVATIFSGVLLTILVRPAIEAFLAYLFTGILYLVADPAASTGWIYLSLIGSLLFLVLNVAIILGANAFFLGKAQKILRQKFQERVPLKVHKRFWGWGSLAFGWSQLLPLGFIFAAEPLIKWLMESMAGNMVGIMISGPCILALGFLLVFWAARGLKALLFIFKYKVEGSSDALVGQLAEAAEHAKL